MGVKQLWRIFCAYTSLHTRTAMEYRSSFINQSLFMFLNDIAYAFIFYFIFTAYGTINGYTSTYALLVFGMTGMSFGIIAVFFGNRRYLHELVQNGQLDYYLGLPIDELFHSLISKSNFDGYGDIIFGLVLVAFIKPQMLLLAILVAILGAAVLLGFMIILESASFYMQRMKGVARAGTSIFVGCASWPVDAFGGITRTILYLIPFAFVGAVPVTLISTFSWIGLLSLFGVAVTMMLIGILVWKWSLRRYESGNMVMTRS